MQRICLKSSLSILKDCQSGSIAVIAAISFTALVIGAGIAADLGIMVSKRSSLQSMADAASLAGAREMTISGVDAARVEAVANSMINQISGQSKASFASASSLSVAISVDQSVGTIRVEVTDKWNPFFADIVSSTITPLTSFSEARVVGAEKICVLAMDETSSGVIALSGESRLTANSCGVYSNSTSSTGIGSYKSSVIEASLICSAGGVSGGTSNFSPAATTDCPRIEDPLIGREPPNVGLCDFDDHEVTTGTATLNPGTYCGGLLVTGDSVVTFAPGVYVIKDGPLEIGKTASVTGEHVGFYLTGTNATFLFSDTTSANLSAPKDGPMAGLLFFEDRSAPLGRQHEIVSDNARNLVGTIYLPRGIFNVSSKKPVADQSAYTAIVAQRIQLNRYPQLVLNTNYDLTDVPVPSGLSGVGGRIVLTK